MQECVGNTPFTVLVTDTCKDCKDDQLTINGLTFEKYVSIVTGYTTITWQKVKPALQNWSLAQSMQGGWFINSATSSAFSGY